MLKLRPKRVDFSCDQSDPKTATKVIPPPCAAGSGVLGGLFVLAVRGVLLRRLFASLVSPGLGRGGGIERLD